MTTSVARSRSQPNAFASSLFAGLPARYDLLAEVLSFGQNGRWRKAMVDAVASPPPGRVLDVATGTAGVALMLAERTGAAVTGVDLTANMLRRGRDRVERRGGGGARRGGGGGGRPRGGGGGAEDGRAEGKH